MDINTLTYITNYDIQILRIVHHNRFVPLDNVLYIISFTTTFVTIALLILLLFLSIKSAELKRKFFQVLLVFVLSTVLSLVLKYSIFRERPFVSFPDIEKLSEAGNSSFPSGHTIEAFATALSVSMLFPKAIIIFSMFCWALLVAYSRMALGVHYPLDVLTGVVIGILTSYFTIKFYNKIFQEKENQLISK